MEALISCPGGRIATLRGARTLDYSLDMSRFLRSVRLAFHPVQAINQCSPKPDDTEELSFFQQTIFIAS
jgi:hypothetical protein